LFTLKGVLASLFNLQEKKLFYYNGKEIKEIKQEADYTEFINYKKAEPKFIVVGDSVANFKEGSINFYNRYELLLKLEQANSPIPSEQKNSMIKLGNKFNSSYIAPEKQNKGNENIFASQLSKEPKPQFQSKGSCFLCYGKKTNKKGLPCKRCHGTGTMVEQDYSLLKQIVAEEVKAHTSTFISEIKENLTKSIRIELQSQESVKIDIQKITNPKDASLSPIMPIKTPPSHQQKPPQIQYDAHPPIISNAPNQIAKDFPMKLPLPINFPQQPQVVLPPNKVEYSCAYCGTPFKDNYYSCTQCNNFFVCDICNSQGFHNHPLEHKSVGMPLQKALDKPKSIESLLSPVKIATWEIKNIKLAVRNTGFSATQCIILFFAGGDAIFEHNYVIATVGMIPLGEAKNVEISIKAPGKEGTYTATVQLGYFENKTSKFIEEKGTITIEVAVNQKQAKPFEENMALIMNMGFDKEAGEKMLHKANNNLDAAIAYLTNP
jgi:hypothetical protein